MKPRARWGGAYTSFPLLLFSDINLSVVPVEPFFFCFVWTFVTDFIVYNVWEWGQLKFFLKALALFFCVPSSDFKLLREHALCSLCISKADWAESRIWRTDSDLPAMCASCHSLISCFSAFRKKKLGTNKTCNSKSSLIWRKRNIKLNFLQRV